MKPRKHESLLVAERVLRLIDLPKFVAKRCSVTCYENGREHGLALRHFKSNGDTRVCVWSEARASDQIVVYEGTFHDFDAQGCIPSDEVYKKQKAFQNGAYAKAARFICKSIQK